MKIVLGKSLTRWVLLLAEVSVFLVLAVWTSRACIAEYVGRSASVENLEHASALDPGDSDYVLRLGRLFQYTPTDMDPDRAILNFRHAAQLNPFDARPWLELAAALEFQAKTDEAERCLHRADFLASKVVAVQWTIANFFLLHRNVDEAFRHLKVVLAGTSAYNLIAFDIAWKAADNADKILNEVIPRKLSTEFSYLDYLLSKKRFPEAHTVWKRIAAGPEHFSPQDVSKYIDVLISVGRPDEAYETWTDLRNKGLIGAHAAATSGNILLNGDFEDDLVNMGFTWRFRPVEGVYAQLDQTTYHSPGHSLQIQFSGNKNVHYRDVYQFVKVRGGQSYQLQGYIKTEGITTDSGVRLEVRDFYDSSPLDKLSENLTGTTTGWMPITVEFKTGPDARLLVVSITRLPSQKLDNLIKGKAWIDDLSLSPIGPGEGIHAAESLSGRSTQLRHPPGI
jgi:hypothetical protein